MLQAGGLIKLHYHSHYDVIEALTDVSGILYYRDDPLFANIQISAESHNHLTRKTDGLFVDGTFLDRFSYHDNELYFDTKIVSREYTDQEITDMVNALWTIDPYLPIGKLDMSYWLSLIYDIPTQRNYKNISDSALNVMITNNNAQELKITIDGVETITQQTQIPIIIDSNKMLIIMSNDNSELDIIVETL